MAFIYCDIIFRQYTHQKTKKPAQQFAGLARGDTPFSLV